jgi:hypothetical protein
MPPDASHPQRREFLKAAVAIGGASALSACLDWENDPDVARGPEDLSTLPDRQHAWDDYLSTDDHGNVVAPRHRVLLLLDYAGDGEPAAEDRQRVQTALRTLERAYKRGNDGLLFTVSYSPFYFDRFDADPAGLELPEPEALASFEDPDPDTPDAVLHLASDYASVVLAAEEALKGEREALNGVDVEASFDGVFEVADRRTGFIGEGLPADNQDVAGIPDSEPVDEEAPLYMGFKSGFKKNQASEDRVTIGEGPFAGGTTQHVSLIRLHLQQWYEQESHDRRVSLMFCPVHAEEDMVEGTGENLGDSSKIEEAGCPAHTAGHADEYGAVGHSQKSARVREDGEPLMIRRDFDSTDDGQASLHFVALQESIEDFVETREAMNGDDVAESSAVGRRNNNGILQYMTVERRGNYLLPPRRHRALPEPSPSGS